MIDLATTSTEQGIEIPLSLLNNVKPSEIGGWLPKSEISPVSPVIVSITERKKKGVDTPDFVLKMRLTGQNVKTYASTIMGVWQAKYNNEPLFEKGSAEGFVRFKAGVEVGYEADASNPQFPFRMVVSHR